MRYSAAIRKGEEPIEFSNVRLDEKMRALDQMSRNDQQTVLDVNRRAHRSARGSSHL